MRGSLTDRAVMVACTVGMSISILVYIIVFQYWLRLQARDCSRCRAGASSFTENLLRYSALPILIGLAVSASRRPCACSAAFVLDEVNQDYVRTARAKGVSRAPHHVGARAAQRVDSDHHARHVEPAGAADRRLPARALLLAFPASAAK